jgi:flagellar assembly factor FliW
MIQVQATRFGAIEVEERDVIEMPAGLIGFASETRFVLLRSDPEAKVAFLQSVKTPHLALPVVDGGHFGASYPSPPPAELAASIGLDTDDVTLLVAVARAAGEPALRANLLAPIVVSGRTHRAAQVVLDARVYSASTPVSFKASDERTGSRSHPE